MKRELRKLGFVIQDRNDSELIWNGERCQPDLSEGIDTYEDHRMALAFAPLAIKFPGIIINNPQVVTKSYPHFWDGLANAGFEIEVNSEK
jgi:3-phosphoshikimate 1-carboxyvinyltransferase